MKTQLDIRLEKRNKKQLRDRTIKAMLADKKITYEEIADTTGVSVITVKRHAKKNEQLRKNI